MITYHNKLVRDKVPEILQNKDLNFAVTHIRDEDEFKSLLIKKLKEEINEFMIEHSTEELADIMEVIDELKDYYPNLEQVQNKKREERGGFKKRIYLKSVANKHE